MNACRAPFRVKICGVAAPFDFAGPAGSAVDAVGLNFFPGSKRFLRESDRKAVANGLPTAIARIGVFVNEPPENVLAVEKELGLDWIQLHGDESHDYLRQISRETIIRVIRCVGDPRPTIELYLRTCEREGLFPQGLLIDAASAHEWGGTGKTLPWRELADIFVARPDVFWILAGGLTPDNVEEAIFAARPHAVDVAGGVESSPGRKDPVKVRLFAERASAALRTVHG